MAIRRVCVMPHEVLRTPAAPITRFTREVRALVDDLRRTMHAHRGVGIAAPQIGRSVRVFVANPFQQSGADLAVVNPVLERMSGETAIVEGCLSLPEVWDRVPRYASVRLRGFDPSGKPFHLDAEGLLAIVLQHEVDHLEGRLFIDKFRFAKFIQRQAPPQERDTGTLGPRLARGEQGIHSSEA